MQPFTAEVVRVLKEIPIGYVVSYGQVARMAGSPRAARQVVRILHTMSEKYGLPWHRVVNIRGEITVPDEQTKELQRMLLQSEDVLFLSDGRVDLSMFK
ncbi:MAG: MGMT family protein [Bacilli bacterium]|nr:MGMT family protein [Bacilli bacterium]